MLTPHSHSPPLSVTQSPSHASPIHSLSLSVTAPPSQCLTLSHTSVTAPRHSTSPPSILSHSDGSHTHHLHPSVSSVRYDFVIVWFVHLGLWFLFQSYGFRVLLCLILLYLYFTKKNVWPWWYHTIIIVIWKVDCTATRVHPPFWWIITKK